MGEAEKKKVPTIHDLTEDHNKWYFSWTLSETRL